MSSILDVYTQAYTHQESGPKYINTLVTAEAIRRTINSINFFLLESRLVRKQRCQKGVNEL